MNNLRAVMYAASVDGTVYNPYSQMQAHIKAAAGQVSGAFNDIDGHLDKGKSIKKAVAIAKGRINGAMKQAIASARLAGFQHGAKVSGKKMPAAYGKDISTAAAKRAKKVDKWMRRTTRRVLRSTPDSEHVLSSERAIAAAKYEIANSYFAGVKDAYRGTGHGKRWITSSEDPCPDCQDNEDDGVIGVDEAFSSGDPYPSAHLSCGCSIVIERLK